MTLCLECDRWYAGSYWAHIYYAHKENESERESW
jgi:hypothetical protein